MAPTAHIRRTKAACWLALAALSFGGLVLAPQSAVLIHRYRWWETDFITSLEQNLNALGGQRLSGHIQCIDTISGCGNALYRMRLEPANGLLVDFFRFRRGRCCHRAADAGRFFAAMNASRHRSSWSRARSIVVGRETLCKLDRWPAFKAFLADDYTLETEWTPSRTARWWSREETPAATASTSCAGSECGNWVLSLNG